MAGKWDNKEVYRKVLSENKRGQTLVIGMVSNGDPKLDIRNYYYDDDDELQPGKGIRVHAEFGPDLMKLVQGALDAVDKEVEVRPKSKK